ncbi:phenylalanine--tRNA ligase subunit beta, partial [candidate division KSB1 bacterium]|nr:phenylalanine--tRNA ligase subunit beta [candidate division KSB1 bacterium]
MKFTYNWLRDFLDTPLSAQEVAEQLMLLGFEVEDFSSTLPNLDGILVAKVVACEPIANSDHLKRCQVDIGKERLEVVCGAPNVASAQWVAFAPVGTTLPGGLHISARKVHGVVSHGMICSEHELGLSDEADRILVLDQQETAGTLLRDVLENDWVIDISVTANRPDALGIIGIAREVGLRTNTPLKLPKIRLSESKQALNKLVKIRIDDAVGCPRYAARLLQNVAVKPSPSWMIKRLNAVGIRAISNLVDVTNYVMMETGQPLHAFDFDTLDQGTIVVRRAQDGERFVTLDERKHNLQAHDLLICDAAGPVALAGVMGGLNSEVKDATRNVLIECAH